MTTDAIQNYLLQNPINRDHHNPYETAATALGVDKEQIRAAWRALRRKGLVETERQLPIVATKTTASAKPPVDAATFRRRGDEATLSKTVDTEIRNELDLANVCDIDLSIWRITEWECKSYNAWIKNKEGEIESQPKFSVYAKMKRRSIDSDPSMQKEELLRELFQAAPELHFVDLFLPDDFSPEKNRLLEISIFDHHFGKLAWGEETGEDYDLKIACDRFKTAVRELLAEVNLERIERILFPIGNDMINIDNDNSTTTAGTPQQGDGRFPKIIRTVKNLLVETITELGVIAPVDVVVVPGNHDYNTMFTIGEILEAYFHNTDRITIYNSPNPRKYYQYGVTGFQYTHGNEEKHSDLGLIFATEEPQIWASSKFRICKIGHFHKQKRLDYVSVDEFQGFIVETLPSLSGTDKWHKKKGYNSIKAAKSFVYDREKGKVGEFTYAV